MNTNNKFTGFAIALAWPQTWCKQPNAWYDSLMLELGISVNHYYRAGHAALVLVDKLTRDCHYFDFGRYHAPFEHGRVRSAETDHDLDLPVKAAISLDYKSLENLREILEYLHQNPACHGNGDLFGSYAEVNFQKAYDKALQMQHNSPIPYGPFQYNGTNCSRFVQSVILAGKPKPALAMRIKYYVPVTPTPMSNVNALPHKMHISGQQPWALFYPFSSPATSTLLDTLPQPERNLKIPDTAKWFAGEGAGSWFYIEITAGAFYQITRYSPEGTKECNSLFSKDTTSAFEPSLPYKILHVSHCNQVRVQQSKQVITFTGVSKVKQDKTKELQQTETDLINQKL